MVGGWSVQSLVREMALSATYRQSSAPRRANDPENLLYSHTPRRRLDIDPAATQFVINLNYLSAVISSQAVGRVFAEQQSGAIVPRNSLSREDGVGCEVSADDGA